MSADATGTKRILNTKKGSSGKIGKVGLEKRTRTLRQKRSYRPIPPERKRRQQQNRRTRTMGTKAREKKVPTQAFVQSQFAKYDVENGETVEGKANGKTEVISVDKFVTEPAKVTVDYGLTMNLGNYETCRVGVAVTVPCYFEELDRAYKWATKWCENRVMAEQRSIRKSLQEDAEDQQDG
jgi:hypothetical protein